MDWLWVNGKIQIMKLLDGSRYISIYWTEFLVSFIKRPQRASMAIPHFSQVEKDWREAGALSQEEYELWKWNVCGMACLKMILKYWTLKEYKTVELAKKCSQYGGYLPEQVEEIKGKKIIPGLFYKALVEFVKKEFGLKALATNKLSVKRMKFELSRGNIIMASISSEAGERHLVVVTGYDDDLKTITLNDPARETGERRLVENEFNDAYNGRGYVFFAPQSKRNS